MKWTPQHDVLLGREMLSFELWKHKSGTREKGNCLDLIVEILNKLKEPKFNVSQKAIRDRIKILESDFKAKKRGEERASGISPDRTEIEDIMEDFLERREEEEAKQEKETAEGHQKAQKDKAMAEDMRDKAMERLAQTRKRSGQDSPRKKRRHSSNDTLEYLREASEKECELKKAELELRKNQEENALTSQQLMMNQFKEQQQLQMQQQQQQQQQFQMFMQMSMQNQQAQTQAMHELLKKGQ